MPLKWGEANETQKTSAERQRQPECWRAKASYGKFKGPAFVW